MPQTQHTADLSIINIANHMLESRGRCGLLAFAQGRSGNDANLSALARRQRLPYPALGYAG